MTNLNIRIPDDLKARLDAFAKKQGVPVTKLVLGEIQGMLLRQKPHWSVILPSENLPTREMADYVKGHDI